MIRTQSASTTAKGGFKQLSIIFISWLNTTATIGYRITNNGEMNASPSNSTSSKPLFCDAVSSKLSANTISRLTLSDNVQPRNRKSPDRPRGRVAPTKHPDQLTAIHRKFSPLIPTFFLVSERSNKAELYQQAGHEVRYCGPKKRNIYTFQLFKTNWWRG